MVDFSRVTTQPQVRVTFPKITFSLTMVKQPDDLNLDTCRFLSPRNHTLILVVACSRGSFLVRALATDVLKFMIFIMLCLKSTTPDRWLQQAQDHLDELLIDHAHCEKKAAGTAMNLLFAYVENEALCRAMKDIVHEELEHFQLVLDLLQKREIRFRRLRPTDYGQQLNALVSKQEPARAIDRLLVASLIEARSCERFRLLRDHLPDHELANFYGSLFESEARHHSTYVQLAKMFGTEDDVECRLDELAHAEAALIATGHSLPRMHS